MARLPTSDPNPRPDGLRDALHLVAGSVIGSLVAIIFFRIAFQREEQDLLHYRQVRDFIASSYVREVAPDELLDRALQGLVEGLDPYSRYYDRARIAGLNRDTSGHYRGIGVVFAPLSPPGQVLFSVEGSPAQAAGIGVGDRIALVEGREVAQLSGEELLALIAASGGRGLELEVVDRAGSPRPVSLVPRQLIDPSVRHARLVAHGPGRPGRVGYVAISSFHRETPAEFDRALEGLGELDALVVDVRGNPGGVLEAAVDIANRFVSQGLLVTHEGRAEVVEYEARAEQAKHLGLPLAVLANGDSASASEVFAAALQEHRAAVVVGSPTYGKGVVQEVRRFGRDRMVVKLTTAYYYTPARRNLERTVASAWESGIQPDLAVEVGEDELRAVTRFLQSYDPPPGAVEALREWETELGVPLVPTHPPDAQLEAALALFRGERPGAWRVAQGPSDPAPVGHAPGGATAGGGQ